MDVKRSVWCEVLGPGRVVSTKKLWLTTPFVKKDNSEHMKVVKTVIGVHMEAMTPTHL